MDEEALLAGIRAEPDDDLVRLAYADWLDEHGRADEAELIRVQIELAAMGEWERKLAHLSAPARVQGLVQREGQLGWELRRKAWAVLASLGCRDIDIRRGILESVSMPAVDFLENGDEVMRRFPVLALQLTDVVPHLQAVIESPALSGLRDLAFDGVSAEAGVFADFGRANHLGGLRSLRLLRLNLNSQAVRTFATARLTHLKRLVLRRCGLNTTHAEALAGSAALARLEELEVIENDDADSWVPKLFHASSRGLRALDLSRCGVRDRGAIAIARSVSLTDLERLNLSGCDIDDEGVKALARSTNFTRLVELSLDDCELSEEGGRAFIESPHLPPELVLSVGATHISPKSFAALLHRYRVVNGYPRY